MENVLPEEILVIIIIYVLKYENGYDIHRASLCDIKLVSKKFKAAFDIALRSIDRITFENKVLLKSSKFLKMCPKINRIILFNTKRNLPYKCKNLLRIFEGFKIKTLTVYNTRILHNNPLALKPLFKNLETICVKTTNIALHNDFTECILECDNLKNLILNSCLVDITEVLNKYSLEILEIYATSFSSMIKKDNIIDSKKTFSNLRILVLKSYIGDELKIYLNKQILEHCNKLTIIEILDNFSFDNINFYQNVVMNNRNLTKINFSRNDFITDKIIENIVMFNKNIKSLILNSCTALTSKCLEIIKPVSKQLEDFGLFNYKIKFNDENLKLFNPNKIKKINIYIDNTTEKNLQEFLYSVDCFHNLILNSSKLLKFSQEIFKHVLIKNFKTITIFSLINIEINFDFFSVLLKNIFWNKLKINITNIVFKQDETYAHFHQLKYFFKNINHYGDIHFRTKEYYYMYNYQKERLVRGLINN